MKIIAKLVLLRIETISEKEENSKKWPISWESFISEYAKFSEKLTFCTS